MNGALRMNLPCEIAVKSVVPAIRALLARELVENHKLKQSEAAELLAITQTAVSKYTHYVRGSLLPIENEDEVRMSILDTAASLANGTMNYATLSMQICRTCRLVREKRLMCELCRNANSNMELEGCDLCASSSCQL
jgi:predicted transcriptional regulator